MNSKLIRRLDKIKKHKKLERIFVTGSQGQLGIDLLPCLTHIYGENNVFATDIKKSSFHPKGIQFEYLDTMDQSKFLQITKDFQPSQIIHFSALLSGTSEKDFEKAININLHGFLNAIKAAEIVNSKIFVPSSIAAYGFMNPEDRINVDEKSQQRPKNIYGITKLFAELVGYYLFQQKHIDFRSLRYPGVFSNILPNGGTTDYAIEMIHDAIIGKETNVYIEKNLKLPFIYIEDLLVNTIKFLETDEKFLKRRTYSISSFSTNATEMYDFLIKYYPNYRFSNLYDYRNNLALSWPSNLLTTNAENDWHFKALFNKQDTIERMIEDFKRILQ